MCGIAGEICFGDTIIIDSKEKLIKVSAPLKFRGPDAEGYYLQEYSESKIALAHKRLSIIDLDPRSNQPMESNDSVIVFNGEIYNFNTLKNELANNGIQFKTKSDTEVLLQGYRHWGMPGLLQRIDGMFAFVLFDKVHQKAYAARDRFGKKPFYFYKTSNSNNFIFSSDIRSFYACELPLSIDMHALGYLFAELSTPEENSIYHEIKKLKPAHFIEFSKNSFSISCYWRLAFTPTHTLSRTEILSETEKRLNEAVRKRMISDVGVCAFLSGGIDSSLITALLAQNSSKKINTYTVGFYEKKYNELAEAKLVSEKYNTNHHEIILTPDNLDNIHRILEEFGEPFADSSSIPTWYVCNEVSKSEKVVLSGDGGDEIFAGYYEYYHYDRVEKYHFLKYLKPILNHLPEIIDSRYLKFIKQISNDAGQSHEAFNYLNRNGMGLNKTGLKLLCPRESFYNSAQNEHFKIWDTHASFKGSLLSKIMSASLHTRLVNDYLVKVDRASMANSLEVRSPFLDTQLVEFAVKIDHHQLLKDGITKSILKDIAAKYLPPELLSRKKTGFGIPVGEWFKKEWKNHWMDVVLSGKSKYELFNYEYIKKIFDAHCSGAIPNNDVIWTIYVFHIWLQSNNKRGLK